MKLAVVINVTPGAGALSQATHTQSLLLEHLGSRLDSIRLAVPRLLQYACRGAIAESPDLLVVVGGPKAARRAGEVAHTRDVPILFLPGMRFPPWARRLWGSLTLEDMIAALASENITPTKLAAGVAGQHLFFDNVTCGLVPHIAQFGAGLSEADTFADSVQLLSQAAGAIGTLFRPRMRIASGRSVRRAAALTVNALGSEPEAERGTRVKRLRSLVCSSWPFHGASHAIAILKALFGGDWRRGVEPERFDCTNLSLDAGKNPWLLLDGEPIQFQGPVEFRFLPEAINTFAIVPHPESANDESSPHSRSRFAEQLRSGHRNSWNLTRPSNVRYAGRR